MPEIVVAVDGSELSKKVVEHAIGLAKATSSDIALVYVTPEVKIPDAYLDYARTERVGTVGYYEEVGKKIVKDAVAQVEDAKVKHTDFLGSGNPAKFILEIAETRRASQIVIGFHGLHRLERIRALGSVARRVVENSMIPVTVVP